MVGPSPKCAKSWSTWSRPSALISTGRGNGGRPTWLLHGESAVGPTSELSSTSCQISGSSLLRRSTRSSTKRMCLHADLRRSLSGLHSRPAAGDLGCGDNTPQTTLDPVISIGSRHPQRTPSVPATYQVQVGDRQMVTSYRLPVVPITTNFLLAPSADPTGASSSESMRYSLCANPSIGFKGARLTDTHYGIMVPSKGPLPSMHQSPGGVG